MNQLTTARHLDLPRKKTLSTFMLESPNWSLKKLANAEQELHNKQKELDESIVEVMNWVPQAISAAHDDRDRDYKQLRVAKSESFLLCQQLTRAQPSLKGTVDDIVNYPVSPLQKPNTTPDINLVLGQELLKAKVHTQLPLFCPHLIPIHTIQEAYKRDVSALNKKVAHLQVQLAATDKMHSETVQIFFYFAPSSTLSDLASVAILRYKHQSSRTIANPPESGRCLRSQSPVLSCGSNQPTAVKISPQPLPQLESLAFQDFMPSKTNAAMSGKDNNKTLPEQFPDGINLTVLSITNCSDKVTVQELPPLQIPAEAANIQWFNHAVQFLNICLGELYHKLLLQWMELERKKKWVLLIKHFKAGQRPKELKKWVDNGWYRMTITVLPNDVD
ncbi:hypothetical protein GYMLUDRAFT_65313 [Collybiopsis luxurians FD-317 M1]|uniref:Uncharacterized protein n=1 Tax=Collybiopsis luxurians FD-317 M1 TaxID=944289 RepID=A0A0D0BY84_9AGAR|nr:hypothetical protein GYMLUDRAFT_65313 [Collybiopsis luxurians FD-317 M1]